LKFGNQSLSIEDALFARCIHRYILSGERAIVETWRLGVAPEEIPAGMPHLRLVQVFAALTYYSDRQDEINQYIEKNRIPDQLIDLLVRDL
jgi:hypothetical protein